MTLVLAPLFGAAIGLSLGLLGGGGSILTVPILVYLVGQDAQAAVTTSLAIVGANALLGSVFHWRSGHVRVRQALAFGAVGMAAAYLAAGLSKRVSDALLLVLFALLMLAIGALMIRPLPAPAPREGVSTGRLDFTARTLATGASVGILTGFLGVGGGFLIVPALVLVLGMPMADAVGSSLLVIGLNSVAGLVGHLESGGLDWRLVMIFALSGTVGLRLGARWSHRWPPERLRRAFAVLVFALAATLLTINLPSLLR